jgi:hypothetical protein
VSPPRQLPQAGRQGGAGPPRRDRCGVVRPPHFIGRGRGPSGSAIILKMQQLLPAAAMGGARHNTERPRPSRIDQRLLTRCQVEHYAAAVVRVVVGRAAGNAARRSRFRRGYGQVSLLRDTSGPGRVTSALPAAVSGTDRAPRAHPRVLVAAVPGCILKMRSWGKPRSNAARPELIITASGDGFHARERRAPGMTPQK